MVGGIWGQTRSYGDTYHWAFHDGTVESVSAVPVFFLRRREAGAGDEVEADISQRGGAEVSGQRANAPRLCASGNFGSGYAALRDLRAGYAMPKCPTGDHFGRCQAFLARDDRPASPRTDCVLVPVFGLKFDCVRSSHSPAHEVEVTHANCLLSHHRGYCVQRRHGRLR